MGGVALRVTEFPLSTHCESGRGGVSGTTGHPEGSDLGALQAEESQSRGLVAARKEPVQAQQANAPLRLERYVGWNLNTGCEVQRKRTGGGGRGKERARPGQFQHH